MYGPREFGPPAPTELKTVNKTEGRHGGNCWSVLLTCGDVTYDTKASKRVLSKQHNFSQSCVPERVLFSENHVINEKRSGYYGNLGSLRAGTRHHGDFSVMGTPSLQPFLKSYWLTPVK